MIAPLLPWPTLSVSARSLRASEELDVQYILAGSAYGQLIAGEPSKLLSVRMWQGYEGALLYWWGCLAAQKPLGPMECPGYVRAWSDAYRRGRMAVGPLPWWLGDTRFHLGCQAALLRQDPCRWGGIFVHAKLDADYIWPTENEGEWQWYQHQPI